MKVAIVNPSNVRMVKVGQEPAFCTQSLRIRLRIFGRESGELDDYLLAEFGMDSAVDSACPPSSSSATT